MRPIIKNELSRNMSNFRSKLIGTISADKLPHDEPPHIELTPLKLTNKHTKYRLNYGEEFKSMLQPRDQVLEHSFDIQVDITQHDLENSSFITTQCYSDLIKSIRHFLVEAVSNVASITFKMLCRGELTETEAKQYASKNIMLNVNSIFSKTHAALDSHPLLKDKIGIQQLTTLRIELTAELDNILTTILVNLADSYPQAPAAGGTPRMREAILNIDRVEDEENDLIYANGIRIGDYMNNEGDYTQFIMKVLNTAMRVVQESWGDSRKRTVRQIFTQFNEQLFWISQQPQYHSVIKHLSDAQSEGELPNWTQGHEKIKQSIVSYFDSTLEPSEGARKQLEQKLKQERRETAKIITSKEFIVEEEDEENSELIQAQFLKLIKNGVEGKKTGKSAIGQKIPGFVKQFTSEQMERKEFRTKYSHLLRIMTKWAGYLEQIMKEPEQYVLQRGYPFKTIHNERVAVMPQDKGTLKLIKQLKEQYREVKKKYQVIVQTSYGFISDILKEGPEQGQEGDNVCRYGQVRKVASKINAVLTYLTLNHLNLLIHHLLRAGIDIKTETWSKQISLVVFRVSDLLRSKLQCDQSSFISVLKTMYLLDSCEEMRGKFKLVRIKNKLEESANNIMVNYLFMGKVQCELQLSIQEPKDKEKYYYMFSHFIYELTRGNFGAIAESAIMITQLDPMISACKELYYVPKQTSKTTLRKPPQPQGSTNSDKQREDQVMRLGHPLVEQDFATTVANQIYHCSSCHKLVIKENNQLFRQKQSRKMCWKCLLENDHSEDYILSQQVKSSLVEALQKGHIQRIKKFSYFGDIDSFEPVLAVHPKGSLELKVAVRVQSELATYLVTLTNSILEDIQDGSLDSMAYTDLRYEDLTKNLKNNKKDKPLPQLTYSIHDLKQVCQMLDYPSEPIEQQLTIFCHHFKEFIEENALFSKITSKVGTFNCNYHPDQMARLERVIMAWTHPAQGPKIHLKLDKEKGLDLQSIRSVQGIETEVESVPRWMQRCSSLSQVQLLHNGMVGVRKGELPSSVVHLNLCFNRMEVAEIQELSSLKYLNLSSNVLVDLDLTAFNLLEYLYLENNQLALVEVNNNRKLKELVLRNNRLAQVDLQGLTQLLLLNLSQNKLSYLNLSGLASVKQLILNKNKLAAIDLAPCQQLEELCLDRNQLTNIEFSFFPRLNTISVQNNKLKSILLGSMDNLKRIDCRTNELVETDIANFPNLEVINFGNNKLEHFHADNLGSLHHLNLEANLLQDIELHHLPKLTIVSLLFNKLAKIKLDKLKSLRSITLDKNQLENMELSNLPKLQTVSLKNNKLTQIELHNVSSIQELYLNANQLSAVDFKEVPSLLTLVLSQNNFPSLDITALKQLRNIVIEKSATLQEVQLKDLPNLISLSLCGHSQLTKVVFADLPCLKELALESNNSLTSFQFVRVAKIVMLSLSNNRLLSELSLSSLLELKRVDLDGCSALEQLPMLPPSLEELWADRQVLLHYDFSQLPGLKRLKVDNGTMQRKDLMNIGPLVKVAPEDKTLNHKEW